MKRIVLLILTTMFLTSCSSQKYEIEYIDATTRVEELESDLEYWKDEASRHEESISDLLLTIFRASPQETNLKNNEVWLCGGFEIMYWVNEEITDEKNIRHLNYKFKNDPKVDYYVVFYYNENTDLYEILGDSLSGELAKYSSPNVDSQGYTQDYYHDYYHSFIDILATETAQPPERYYYIVAVIENNYYSAVFNP